MMMKQGIANVDLLITDLDMPRMQGDELARWFVQENPLARVPGNSNRLGSGRVRRFPLSQPRGRCQSPAMEETPPGDAPRVAARPLPAAKPAVHRSLRGRVQEWLGEIVIVFVGVYAAFLLNAWQTQRQDRSNHLLILQSLDEEVSDSIKNLASEIAYNQNALELFQRQLAAGEMPALHTMTFATDYDPADDVALSQAGADHLLKFKTVQALKQSSSTERTGFMLLRDHQQLSYELIAPRLDDPKETFYDPQTRRLKPMFAWYLTAMQDANKFLQDSLAADQTLLTQVRGERAELR